MKRPGTLFARTGITVGIAFTVFLLFSGAVVVNYILVPIAKRAAEDLATLMVLSTQTWVELPPATRPAFEKELLENYQLKIGIDDTPFPATTNPLPYLHFIETALEGRLGERTVLLEDHLATPWYYADIPMGGRIIRVGFPRSRVTARPPLAVLLVIVAGAAAIALTTLLLVRRLTRPLERLSEATSRLGHGEFLDPLPETGPRELVELTRNFNQMARQLHELIENRTTLLAGISHDLRTPLTRMRLALEMLPSDPQDPGLIERMRQDIEQMDDLISVTLALARGKVEQASAEVELREFIDGLLADYRRQGADIGWNPEACHSCPVALEPVALQRILSNLVDNALRYGDATLPSVECHCEPDAVRIQVLDRGAGIPESEREAVFRPFHRLESSRNRKTGGSGLGLAIARQLAGSHGWTLDLLPRTGGGTVAQLRIPRTPVTPCNNPSRH